MNIFKSAAPAALALALGCFMPAAQPAFATSYTLVDLGDNVEPQDVNNSGTVVGARFTNQYPTVAFRYTAAGGMQDLAVGAVAYAVNDALAITGTTYTGSFLIDASDTVIEWTGHSAYGINEQGWVSGNKAMPNPYRPTPLPLAPALFSNSSWDFLDVAFTYPRGTRLGVYADLYVLNDINAGGASVGQKSRYGLFGSSAILIEPSFDAVTFLPIPNGGSAQAINDQNLIVGTTGSNSSNGEYSYAFLYDGNSVTNLGTLHGGLTSYGADINEANQVVGSSWLETSPTSVSDPSRYHAFLWENAVMHDLNDVLADGSGWILTAASAISDHGDIVGTGLVDGVSHGFLLVATGTTADSDNDGIADTEDNCTLLGNPDQRDTDADHYGNACDPDLNGDGQVNFIDLGELKQVFFSTDVNADFDGDGAVNFSDLARMKAFFFQPPGPSGIAR